MTRIARFSPLLGVALPWLLTSAAEAQQAFTSGLEVIIDGKTQKNGALAFGTVDQCLRNVKFQFKADYSSRINVIEAWVGVGTTDCSSPESRKRPANNVNAVAPCKRVGLNNSVAKMNITVEAREIFVGAGEGVEGIEPGTTSDEDDVELDAGATDDADASADDVDAGTDEPVVGVDAGENVSVDTSYVEWNGCHQQRGSPVKVVYFLALEQETNIDTQQAPAVLNITKGVLKATFTPYTGRPTSPQNIRALTGETRLGVRYDAETASQAAQTQYRAYFDYGTGGSIGCGAGVLEPRDGVIELPNLDEVENVVASKAGKGDTATIGDLDELGIPIGGTVAVSAVTIDPAGNESLPSSPICVKRVETQSFYDACQADSKCRDGLSTCSLGATPLPSWYAGLSLTALGLTFALRRRRKA